MRRQSSAKPRSYKTLCRDGRNAVSRRRYYLMLSWGGSARLTPEGPLFPCRGLNGLPCKVLIEYILCSSHRVCSFSMDYVVSLANYSNSSEPLRDLSASQ